VCLDIADVVRDEPTILRKKIEDLRQLGAFVFPVERSVAKRMVYGREYLANPRTIQTSAR